MTKNQTGEKIMGFIFYRNIQGEKQALAVDRILDITGSPGNCACVIRCRDGSQRTPGAHIEDVAHAVHEALREGGMVSVAWDARLAYGSNSHERPMPDVEPPNEA